MKFCGKCGAELKDDAKFCGSCGEPCNSTSKKGATKAHNFRNRAPIIGIAIVLIVALMFGFAAVRWYTSPEQQALRAVDAGNYTTVLNIINRNKTIAKSDNLINKLNKRIHELEFEYKNEQLSYEDVCDELEMIGHLGISALTQQMEDSRQTIYELYCERNLETFYLCTSQVNVTAGVSQSTITWDYDEQGRLTGYSTSTTYSDSGTTDYNMGFSYIYGASGKIDKTVFTSVEGTYTLFASYSNDLLMDYSGEIDGETGTFRFGYDENGNMISIEAVGSDGYTSQIITMSYYGDGILREIRENIASFIRINMYNRNGKQSEMSLQYGNGDYAYRYIYDYNAQGQMTYQAVYYENATEPSMITRLEYDNEGRLIAIGGESNGSSYYALGVWDESNRKVTFTTMDGSDEVKILQEYDEAGNCIRNFNYINGALQSQTTYTYITLQLPPDYEKPDINDPQYLVLLSGLI